VGISPPGPAFYPSSNGNGPSRILSGRSRRPEAGIYLAIGPTFISVPGSVSPYGQVLSPRLFRGGKRKRASRKQNEKEKIDIKWRRRHRKDRGNGDPSLERGATKKSPKNIASRSFLLTWGNVPERARVAVKRSKKGLRTKKMPGEG